MRQREVGKYENERVEDRGEVGDGGVRRDRVGDDSTVERLVDEVKCKWKVRDQIMEE